MCSRGQTSSRLMTTTHESDAPSTLRAGLIDRGQRIEPHPFPLNPPTGGDGAAALSEEARPSGFRWKATRSGRRMALA